MAAVTHVIFDLDGTLIDTEGLYSKAIGSFCERRGKQFTLSLKQKQMGRPAEVSAQILLDELDIADATVEDYIRETHANLVSLCPADLMPGAERLLKHLDKYRIPFALCTSSSKELYSAKTAGLEKLFSLFSHLCFVPCDPEIKFGKPHPQCFLVCASRFQSPPLMPSKVLVFEDADTGVQAGLAAAMNVVHVRDERFVVDDRKHQQRAAGSTSTTLAVIDSLEQFKPEAYGLPAYA